MYVKTIYHSLPLGPSNGKQTINDYFDTLDGDSEDRMLRPASVYSPNRRTVAIASKVTGTHIPLSSANCTVR